MTTTNPKIHEGEEPEGKERDKCEVDVEKATRERQTEIDKVPYT